MPVPANEIYLKRNSAHTGIACFAAAASAISYVSAARADVKIVSEVSFSGTVPTTLVANAPAGSADGIFEPARADGVYTTYFKNNKARRESNGGSIVTLYDKSAGKVYTISLTAKKYFVVSFREALDNGGGLPKSIGETMNLITSVDLDSAGGSSDSVREVAGTSAEKMTLFGSVAAGPKSANSPGFAPAGGPFSKGNTGVSANTDPAEDEPMALLGRSTLNGSLWVVNAASILAGGKKAETDMSVALLQQELPAGCPILKSLVDALGKKRYFPLASKIVVRVYGPADGGASAADPGGNGFHLASADKGKSVTITTEVKSIEMNVSLDDSLFQLPAGLEQVSPPSIIMPLPLGQTP